MRLVIENDVASLNISSANQGDARIPASQVSIDGERIRLTFNALNATFEGALNGNRYIDGVLIQGRSYQMRFTRGQVAEGLPHSTWAPLTPELLNDKRIKADIPAMGAAWSRGKKSALFVKGVRSSDATIAVQPDDQWHWGSVTKSMTATLCARLVEAGVIDWDTSIGHVLDAPGAHVPESYRDATLLHLLSHRAGLQHTVKMTGLTFELEDARAERLKYARAALEQKPTAAVGEKMAYSNNGYVVVGAMLERLTGKPWEVLIQTEVFKPLGIRQAGQGSPGRKGRIDQPLGHTVTDGKRVPDPAGMPGSDNEAVYGPAGRVHMPLADMITYLKAHRDRPAKFLKAESWSKLHTPHFGGSYALGWVLRNDGSLWHSGTNTMWYAEVMVDTRTGTVCASCANDATPATSATVADLLMSARNAIS
jgi:CubicO group peptidase (beta-lactamase class C family)